MTDREKLSKIRAEIKKQRQLIRPKNTGEMKVVDIPKPLEQGWLNALKWMEGLIDSMQEEPDEIVDKYLYGKEPELVDVDDLPNKDEEPISKDFEAALAECINQAQCAVVDPMAHAEIWKDELIKLAKSEEPVSEDLEEGLKAMEYDEPKPNLYRAAEEYSSELSSVIITIGNNDDNSNHEYIEQAFIDGANWQKEQMIKKAFPVEVGRQRSDYKCMLNGNFSCCNTGDKVKVIVIKED